MNHSIIRYTLVSVLEFAGFFLLIPYFVGLLYGEKERYAFLLIAAACLLIGFAGRLFKPKSKVFYAREGFVTVSLSWIILSLIGAVPFVLTGEIPSYVDAVLKRRPVLPQRVLPFLRMWKHWHVVPSSSGCPHTG